MPHAEDNATFPSRERLKSNLAIQEVVSSRNSVWAYPIRGYFYVIPSEGVGARQLAVVAPKKRLRRAVDRNRVKRLMREAYRLNKQLLPVPEGKIVRLCWVFQGQEVPSFEAVCQAVRSILNQIRLRTEEVPQ